MIIDFTVGNYLSIHDRVTLSMLALNKVSEFRDENVARLDRVPLLKTAAIYGANASGKSNILASLVWMRWFVINSQKETQAGEAIEVKPFKLDVDCADQPSHFEATFLLEGVRYRYGFEVNAKRVVKEWLYRAAIKAETELFVRIEDDIDVSRPFGEGKAFVENTRSNALFISTVASLNGTLSTQIVRWFQRLVPVHGLLQGQYVNASIDMIKDEESRGSFVEFIRMADLGIEDFLVKESGFEPSSKMFPPTSEADRSRKFDQRGPFDIAALRTLHTRFRNGHPVDRIEMDFIHEESEGTQKFFSLLGPIFHSLAHGCVMIVDELEAHLHPLLTRLIVRLFHSPAANPKNAQLIFATHDANLLQYGQFRRDQIWFVEKTPRQASDLYSLAEIKMPTGKVRKDASYEKDYFRGRYGAVPYLADFELWFENKEPVHGKDG